MRVISPERGRGGTALSCVRRVKSVSFPVRITKVWNELPDSVVTAPNVKTFKNRLDRHWKEEDFLYNHGAPIPGHHLAEDRDKRVEHVVLTIEANACGHEGTYK